MNLAEKYNSLQQILRQLGKVLIAYSGGVDSTLLLRVAVDTLGAENVSACIARGPSLPKSQYDEANKTTKDMGVELETVVPNELADPKYRANKADRCFHCKSHLLVVLVGIAKKRGIKHVLCGSNFDDRDDFRPGNKALENFGIRCPLMETELTKNDIRQLSRQLNLPTADKPASPCLASRISYGLEITEQRLKQIEQAEQFLKELGLIEFRVRHHDTIARIEVHAEDIDKITSEPRRTEIIEKFKSFGFTYVTIDLQGFRSGSLNELLSEKDIEITKI